MKKILYLSNIQVPYRVTMFNEFAKACKLTVLYERKKSLSRVDEWAKSEDINFDAKFLKGINIRSESSFSFGIIRYLFKDYDEIIVGCYNSPVQMFAILLMKLFRKSYIINLDGEPFLEGNSIKSKLKRFFLKGAKKYLVAGEMTAASLKDFANEKDIIPYYFSSLTEAELAENSSKKRDRDDFVLVVGQYLYVKGLDVALEAARLNTNIKFKFIGMGNKTDDFINDYKEKIPDNVEIIPFLNKQQLEAEYLSCSVFVLPSRQECWGLVINEAASYGTPIVSTHGSGAAVEFLHKYPDYLVPVDDSQALLNCIEKLLKADVASLSAYSDYLLSKSKLYSIEHSVSAHCYACGIN